MSGGLSLRVVAEDGLMTYRLPETGEVVIGRGPESDLRVDDRSLSRRHAAIAVKDGVASIADLGSANGTRVAERAIEPNQPAPIQAGDVIDLGEVMVIVQGVSPAPADDAAALDRLQRLLRRVARAPVDVLIQAERGTDRAHTAERVRQLSPRAGRPIARLDCAGLEASALEGLADFAGGTLLLDEVAALTPALQLALLSALDTGADLRVVATTGRDLEAAVTAGDFRRDLHDRLAGVVLVIPVRLRR